MKGRRLSSDKGETSDRTAPSSSDRAPGRCTKTGSDGLYGVILVLRGKYRVQLRNI